MNTIQSLLKEMETEAQTTRKMLERVPTDKFDWQPHQKSMSIRQLTNHIAELPGWVSMVLDTDELDFMDSKYKPESHASTGDVISYFEKSFGSGKTRLETATENELMPDWTLRSGNDIFLVQPKGEVIRMAFSQTVHHRAQLGVYLRLLDIPIPGSYGPSADEH